MRSRSIDNYLSREELELITAFLDHSMKRFDTYDGRVRMAPQRFKTDELQKLYIEKLGEWEKAVENPIPDSSSTHLDLLRMSEDSIQCPIERFLKALMQIIQQAIPPSKHKDMLQKLETGLVKCEYSCPCPAEP